MASATASPRRKIRGGARQRVPGAERAFARFLEIVRRLRDPDGCPWDRKQTPQSLRAAILEEAHEAGEAIAARSCANTREELGDVMLVTLAVAVIHEQRGDFTLGEVFDEIRAKLVRRHPHVFSNTKVSGAEEVITNWNRIKEQEKKAKGISNAALRLPKSMPALLKARRLDERLEKLALPRPAITAAARRLKRRELAAAMYALTQRGRALHLDLETALHDYCQRLARAAGKAGRT